MTTMTEQATVDTVADQQARSFLHWLAPTTAINLFIKMRGKNAGGIFSTDDALSALNKRFYDPNEFYDDADVAAIWTSIHRLKPDTDTSKDRISASDVEAYQYLAIDVDPKQHDVSATEAQRAAVVIVVRKIERDLKAFGNDYGLFAPAIIDTGNGGLLLYPIDFPVASAPTNVNTMETLAGVLKSIYDTDDCKIDATITYNPSQLVGVVGTMNRSKPEQPDEGRIHRVRKVIGDLPPRQPMQAIDFAAFASAYITTHQVQQTTSSTPNSANNSATTDDPSWPAMSERKQRCIAYLEKCPDAISGNHGHDKTLRAACECFRFALDRTTANEVMKWFNDSKCNGEKWDGKELNHKLDSAESKVRLEGEYGKHLGEHTDGGICTYDRTDMGNAEFFIHRYGNDLHYVEEWKKWIWWDGKRWEKDTSGKRVEKRAIRFIKHDLLKHANKLGDDRALKWAIQSQQGEHVTTMMNRASTMRMIKTNDLNQHPWLFNVRNGTIDLKTGKLRAHDRDDLLTQLAPVDFDATATCPFWDNLLKRILSTAMIDYIQRAVGYSMTGDLSEKAIFMLFGLTDTGKSTFSDGISSIMGDDYACPAQQSVLLSTNKYNKTNDEAEAQLFGKRFATLSEPDEGQHWHEGNLKRLGGITGSKITARFLYENSFKFVATHKFWLDTNHLPVLKGVDDAVTNRLKIIKFSNVIPKAEQISAREVINKLDAEASGILNWMIAGCLSWLEKPLSQDEPTAINDAVKEYETESDLLGQFLDDTVVKDKTTTDDEVGKGLLYQLYEAWCGNNGVKYPLAQHVLGRKLKARGWIQDGGKRNFLGVRLKDQSAVQTTATPTPVEPTKSDDPNDEKLF
jgi:putative DNA primase/helicase